MSPTHSVRTVLAIIISIFSVVNGHMVMKTPFPYGPDSLDNSPLAADGSDFPCKLRSDTYAAPTQANNFAIGEPQTLSFTGSAVHGGGSCQVSLTTDAQPDKSSTWMVIHSIEGGCPSNVTGNLDSDPSGGGAADFQFSVPDGINPGSYTLAWSWVNKVGNREFYMNCAPVTVTAAKKKRYAPSPSVSKKRASFPAMFVANLNGVSNGCTTTEDVDIQYPDPGSSVEIGTIGVNLQAPVGCTGNSASSSSGGSSSNASSSPASSAPAATSSAAALSVSPGVFASNTATASAPVSSASAASIASSAPAASSASTAAAPSSGTSSSSPATSSGTSGATQSGACTDEGAYACSADGSSFQRCASGSWSAAIPMAAGTSCAPGTSDTLNMTATKKLKRSTHPGHVRRTHHAWGM